MNRLNKKQLREESFWAEQWSRVDLPVFFDEDTATPFIKEILKKFRQYFPNKKGLKCLEIGAAPGGYLAYIASIFPYKIYALDNSKTGCLKLIENFKILKLPVTVYTRDIIEDDLNDLPKFDIVFSLGLVEHFVDPTEIIRKHVQMTRMNGTILIGMPNFLGINWLFMRILKPEYLTWHNLRFMNLKKWVNFEKEFGLKLRFKGYVGGWEPRNYRVSAKSVLGKIANKSINLAANSLDKIGIIRKLNSRWWSGYAITIWKKTNE